LVRCELELGQPGVGPARGLVVPHVAAAKEQACLDEVRRRRPRRRAYGCARRGERVAAVGKIVGERGAHGLTIGASASPMRPICCGVIRPPRIAWKRASCTPDTMYCQRYAASRVRPSACASFESKRRGATERK